MTARAIPALYNGITYKSQLEARWAVFFDTLCLPFEYEPEGFELETASGIVRYRPDFYLSAMKSDGTVGTWLEIKPFAPLPEEETKAEALAIHTGHTVFILQGPPANHIGFKMDLNGYPPDQPFVFSQCGRCCVVGMAYDGHTNDLHCGHDTGRGNMAADIMMAADKARRFTSWTPRG